MTDDSKTIIMEGDRTGQGLLEEALRVLDPGVSRVPIAFERDDLSLPNRRTSKNTVIDQAAAATAAFTDEVIRRITAKLEVRDSPT